MCHACSGTPCPKFARFSTVALSFWNKPRFRSYYVAYLHPVELRCPRIHYFGYRYPRFIITNDKSLVVGAFFEEFRTPCRTESSKTLLLEASLACFSVTPWLWSGPPMHVSFPTIVRGDSQDLTSDLFCSDRSLVYQVPPCLHVALSPTRQLLLHILGLPLRLRIFPCILTRCTSLRVVGTLIDSTSSIGSGLD